MEPTIYKPSIYNGNGVYNNGAGGGGGGGAVVPLPEGYTQIDFLQIKAQNSYRVKIPFTGVRASYANTDNRIEVKFEIEEFNSSNPYPEFVRDQQTAKLSVVAYMSSPKALNFRNGGTSTQISNLSGIDLKTFNELIVDKSYIKFGSIEGTYSAAYSSTSISDVYFGNNYGEYWAIKEKIFSVKLSKNGLLFYYGIPAKNSNDEEGLFDLISSTFIKPTTAE